MPLSRDSRQKKKLKAFRRAQFGLKQRFERIDWEEDFLYPELAELDAGRPVLGLTAGSAFTLEAISDENPSPIGTRAPGAPSHASDGGPQNTTTADS